MRIDRRWYRMRKEPNHARLAQCSDSLCCNPHHWTLLGFDERRREEVFQWATEPHLVVEAAMAGDSFALKSLGVWAWNNANWQEYKPTVLAILKNR